MKFDRFELTNEVKDNLNKLKFFRTTDIQFKAIPPILKGEDVLAIAQTGTGKTAAFAIPIINKLQKEKLGRSNDFIKCLVMVPTRELAIQITEVFESLSKGTGVRSICITGGVDQDPQIAKLKKGVDILIATPGRMFDLISQGYINVNSIRILVLDEADHMLNLGFIKDIKDIVSKLPQNRQTLFFSATIDDRIKKTAYLIVRNAIRIQISPENPVNKNIHHTVASIEMDDKRFFLERLINEHEGKKILVFVRTKVRAERVLKAMERVGIVTKTIHGDKEQNDRLTVLNEFKKGLISILIATDVSARGIDIPNVDYVVNYDLPDQAENYVHRVGRTGRADNKGFAVSFCSNEEKTLLKDIEDYIGHTIEVLTIFKKDYEETIDYSSDESATNWRDLIANDDEKPKKRGKRK
ncbi:MAG: DEAD/DEAH box helicase [bacterium]|nr:DEAD/DEAH box helicase [bacterium]